MSAERTPQTGDSLLSAPLALLTRLALRFPAAVIVAAVVLAVVAVAFSARQLGFRTSRLDLLNPESSYNQLWIDYIEEFGDDDDAVVVVQGADRGEVVRVLDEISVRLRDEHDLFHAVLHEVDLSRIRSKGLHYLSVDELLQIEQSLDQIDPLLRSNLSHLRIDAQLTAATQGATAPHNAGRTADPSRAAVGAGTTTDSSERSDRSSTAGPEVRPAGDENSNGLAIRTQAAAHLDRLAHSLSVALNDEGSYISPWPVASDRLNTISQIGPEYLLTDEGRLGFILLRLVKEEGRFARGTTAIDRLRTLLDEVGEQHPGVGVGLTGLPVMENDEMRTSQSDMLKASLISLFGVACLFMAGLGGVRHPLMTVGTLVLAMAWSFGYVTLAVGHLNILSVSFGVILIGLGIDFGIHYVARYLQTRGEIADSGEALVHTARTIGPGVVTGAVTTAIAFFTARLTEFTGIAELGVIAGGGIVLCLVATLLVLPAMLYLSDRGTRATIVPRPLKVNRWVAPLVRFPLMTLLAAVVVTTLAAAGLNRLAYDHNLLNLQPEGLESVELERMLLTKTDHSVWYALSIAASREELLARKERFLSLPSVDRTEEIVSLLPTDHAVKGPLIARISARLEDLPERPPLIPVASPDELGRAMAAAQVALPADHPRAESVRRRLGRARDGLRQMPASEAYERVSDYQQRLAGDLLAQLRTLQNVANPEPPTLADLPQSLVTRFVGRSNQHLLKIYGRGNIWDMDGLERFVADVKSIDPSATGQPLQTYYASRQMQKSYITAALYALIAALVVLLCDFGSIRMMLLALLPVAVGMVQMFGLMGWLGIPLNPANMIVLPLILGIGLDDGVHVVHDFRQQRGRYRISGSTATALLVTSLTTMVGFGSLMFASHRGLQSLGRVLTIGVTCCLVCSLVLLPALLSWISRRGERVRPAAGEEHSASQTATVFEMPGTEGDILEHVPEEAEQFSPRRRAV